jgi:hypothetical protein
MIHHSRKEHTMSQVKILQKEKRLPDKAPRQGKNDLLVQSHNQANPRDARPEDFEPITEELEFSGACGNTPAEYKKLLEVGPRARKDPDLRK